MESTRQQKINSLLQKDLSSIFLHDIIVPNTLVSVTFVRVTSDLSLARVNLSLFATKDKEASLHWILERKSEIRHLLATRVKHQLRIIPELQFFIDSSLDQMERIDELLKR